MLEILEPLVSGAKPAVFLDLHSFSAPGTPFTVMGDTLSNRKIAFQLPIPIILGLEETLQGTLLEYLGDHGQIALAVEGGSHQDPRTIDRHEAVIWMALVAAGCLKEHQVERFADHHRELAQCSTSKPRVVEILHRHEITPADRFVMRPGYVNFQPVQENEVLAHDREGEVRSPRSALLLMPLYQKQGAEGFFLSQPVRQFWLTLSAVLRYLHLAPVACWFPGVQRHPEMPLALRVNRRVARWWVREIFHLLGYRHVRSEGEQEIYLRRHEARS
jgi:succinylglutamate desuccinylase